jgi:hypothetical protein
MAVGQARADIESSESDGYDIWTVSGTEIYDLSDGEVLENILVDQTADGASLTIRSQNKSGWEVRNVGFLGTGTNEQYPYQFQVSAPSGDTGLIENVWLNGKDDSGGAGTGMGGIFLRSAHGGHIDIRHTYIEGFGNNAVYGSNCHPDDGGNGGTVAIENAFHRDNTISQFRLGTDGSVVRNSVGIVNDPDLDRGEYSDGSHKARGMWSRWDGEVTIENCSIHIDPDDPDTSYPFHLTQGATLNVVDCDVNPDAPKGIDECGSCTAVIDNFGENPSVDVIQNGGVPLSAEMAASGQRDMPSPSEMPGGDTTTNRKTLTIDGSDVGDSTYSLSVTGDLEGTDSLGYGDSIDGSSAEGAVSGGVDEYLFTGELDGFEQDGNATILIDGEVIDPGTHSEQKALTIDGSDVGESAYSLSVTGDLEGTDSLGYGDSIDGSSAEGAVSGGVDEYLFTGELDGFEQDGNATILIDGEVIDPGTHSEQKALTIDGSDVGESAYSLSVTGDLEGTDSLGYGDSIDGSSAEGAVSGGVDEYRFTGELEVFEQDGNATVLIDGEVIDIGKIGRASCRERVYSGV